MGRRKFWVAEREGDIGVDSKKNHTDSKSLTTFLVGCVLGGRKFWVARHEGDIGVDSKKSHANSKSLTTFLV